MENNDVTPKIKKMLEEIEKKPGTQKELAERIGIDQRTIREFIRKLKPLKIEIPFVLKSHQQKVYYLKKKPIIKEEKKVSKTEEWIKELIERKPSDVYGISKETGLSLSRVREIMIKLNISSVRENSGKKIYYIKEKPKILFQYSETQKKILNSIVKNPKTSVELAEEIGVGFKAIRESIKKITEQKVYKHKINNIVYYCLKNFDPNELELKKDVKKKQILNLISKKPVTVLQLAKKINLSTATIYTKIHQLKSKGYNIKDKKDWNERFFYIGKEPKIERGLTPTQKKIVLEFKKGRKTSLELAQKFGLREDTILDNVKVLRLRKHDINSIREGKQIFYYIGKETKKEEKKADELEAAAKATYAIPDSSMQKPFRIPTKRRDFFKLGVANTVYGGARTDKTLFKNFLKYCKNDKCDAIILNGNLIWMDLMTYSKNKPDRSRISSRNIDPAFIEYPDSIRKFRDPNKLVKKGETVYITFKEKMDMILKNEFAPLFLEKCKKIFDKPIYILFGGMEDELRRQHTNLINRIKNRKEIEFVNNRLLSIRLALQKNPKHEQLSREMNDWEEYKSRILMGNIDDVSTQKISRAMQGYIIQKLENAVPNSKVISVGEGYVKANNVKILVLYNAKKTSDSISDHLINYAIKKIQAMLGSGEHISPDIIITGGLSPYYVAKPITYATKNGNKNSIIIQLPTCLEEEELKKLVRTSVSSKDVLTKLGNNPKLTTGAVIIENHNGINKRKLLTSEFLIGGKQQSKIFYELNVSDEHVGSKFVSIVETKKDILYFTEAYQRVLKDMGAPIVRINNLGDEIQGLNYEVWRERHPEFMETHELLKDIDKNPKSIRKITKRNSIRSGVLLPPDQINLYMQLQNIPFLKSVLKRAEKSNVYGGVINFTEGNHSLKTSGYQISTKDIQKELILRLKTDTSKITANIMGMSGIRESVFGIIRKDTLLKEEIEKNHFYAEYNRHASPGSKNASYASRILDARLMRGRTFKEHEGRILVSRFGHLHAGLEAYGNGNIMISCYCGQERTDYEDVRDYPLVTEGVRIVGYPEKGLSAGPLIFIDLFKSNILDCLNKDVAKKSGFLFE